MAAAAGRGVPDASRCFAAGGASPIPTAKKGRKNTGLKTRHYEKRGREQ